MVTNIELLDTVRVASPCHADWEQMEGTDRARFCMECKRTVYNLSDMTREQAIVFLQESEGRQCVRFYQRTDGTILTKDCPVGLRRARVAFARRMAAFASFAAFLFDIAGRSSEPTAPATAGEVAPIVQTQSKPAPPVVMGKIAAPPTMIMGEVARWNPSPPKPRRLHDKT